LVGYVAGLRLYQKEHQRQKQKEHQHALRCSSDDKLKHAIDFPFQSSFYTTNLKRKRKLVRDCPRPAGNPRLRESRRDGGACYALGPYHSVWISV